MILSACSENQQSNSDGELHTIQDSLISEDHTAKNTSKFGESTYFDSLHFHIIRRKFKNGNTYIESITDHETKIDSWKEYYYNGLSKESGRMTTSSHHYIGKWEYYSEQGKLDSLIDFEIKEPISYFKVIKIAKNHGF